MIDLSGPGPGERPKLTEAQMAFAAQRAKARDDAPIGDAELPDFRANLNQAIDVADAIGNELGSLFATVGSSMEGLSADVSSYSKRLTAATEGGIGGFFGNVASSIAPAAAPTGSRVEVSTDLSSFLVMVKMQLCGDVAPKVLERTFVGQKVQHEAQTEQWTFSFATPVEEDLGPLGPVVGQRPYFEEVWSVDHRARRVVVCIKNTTAIWAVNATGTVVIEEMPGGSSLGVSYTSDATNSLGYRIEQLAAFVDREFYAGLHGLKAMVEAPPSTGTLGAMRGSPAEGMPAGAGMQPAGARLGMGAMGPGMGAMGPGMGAMGGPGMGGGAMGGSPPGAGPSLGGGPAGSPGGPSPARPASTAQMGKAKEKEKDPFAGLSW